MFHRRIQTIIKQNIKQIIINEIKSIAKTKNTTSYSKEIQIVVHEKVPVVHK